MLNAEDYPGRCWSGSATNTAHKGTRITCPDNLLLIRLSTITLGTGMESASLPLSPQPFETPKSQSTTPPLSRAEPSLVLVPVHQIENCPCQDLTIHGCEHALWAVSSTCLPFLLTRTFLSQLFLRVFRGLRFGLQRLVSLRCCFAFRSYFGGYTLRFWARSRITMICKSFHEGFWSCSYLDLHLALFLLIAVFVWIYALFDFLCSLELENAHLFLDGQVFALFSQVFTLFSR